MRCDNCGFENPGDGRFCGRCGEALPRICPSCGAANPADFRFCGQCGVALEVVASAGAADDGRSGRRAGEAGAAPPAERRHLAVMFCDLVGSTALSLRLDPEELREIVRAWQSACAGVIERFGGYIAQYLGDGILAYFGYPVADEDEGGRAASAGLEIVQAVRALGHNFAGTDLAVRIGIHTGVVVIGEMGGGSRRERLALGDAPNIAARLQSLAPPDTVVVSSETHRLIERNFDCEALGVRDAKGIPASMLYRVLRRRALREPDSRAQSAVGRERELEHLDEEWRRAGEGEGRVVCLIGDPGIGKTNLLAAFQRRTETVPCMRLETRCLPYYRNTPFFPFIDLLEREWDCRPDRPVEDRLDAISSELARSGFPHEETASILASLLSLPGSESDARELGTPEQVRDRTRELIVQLIVRAATGQPLILTVEDLHWADPSTLEVLDRLVDEVGATRLLVLFSWRPEFPARWTDHPNVRHFPLARLGQEEVERLVSDVTGGRALPREVLRQIIDRTDGVPLFVEELTKMVLESGLLLETENGFTLAGPLTPLAIPATLRDSLEARLDRLAPAKQVAQLGATIGREFSHELLRALARSTDDQLRDALDQLVDAGLLRRTGEAPHVAFQFKHALIQEAAYDSLLRSTRQMYHERIARVLEEQFVETASARPEVVAQHYTAAGLAEAAVEAWKRAGRRALERSANAEAIEHLQQGLSLIGRLADGDRDLHELDLLCLLAPALVATRGYTSPHVRDTYVRARELSRQAGRVDQLFQVLGGLFAHYFVRSETDIAKQVADELVALAAEQDDPTHRLVADAASGLAHFGTGSLSAAHEALSRVNRAYDPDRHRGLAVTYGQDFGVVGYGHSAILLWLVGSADQAREMVQRALATAERLDHAHSLALALGNSCTVHYYSRDVETVHAFATRLGTLAGKQGFRYWAIDASLYIAWTAAHAGRHDEALRLTRDAQALMSSIGIDEPQPFLHPLVVDIYACLRMPEEGLRMADAWQALLEQKRAPWWCESELHRLRAHLLLQLRPDDPQIEPLFIQALDTARKRRGLALELRAVTGLADLWQRQGRAEEARSLLSDCLESFNEGLDTGDLLDARRLLERLEVASVH